MSTHSNKKSTHSDTIDLDVDPTALNDVQISEKYKHICENFTNRDKINVIKRSLKAE